ncbi:GNAT family N-acetyltransferase [Exiguobacterium aurantiacum]|uniref:GNAT family N-acetyltransferase n=1 Tax=Exiguobacterium aurantiacum TaxID=33987 RepID=UPI001E3A49ED|nr:GNAT family N-acetyltransferase [Exiguobacterium aurantiacum]
MKIDFLSNRPDKIKEVSEIIYEEFVINTGSTMRYDDVLNHFSNTGTHAFPITLIALENEHCLGTVSIFENDLKSREMYGPWLASLYTKPECRNRGIGQKLIARTIDVVKELGFPELYLRTEHASVYYKKRGWAHVETVRLDSGEEIDVFKITCI